MRHDARRCRALPVRTMLLTACFDVALGLAVLAPALAQTAGGAGGRGLSTLTAGGAAGTSNPIAPGGVGGVGTTAAGDGGGGGGGGAGSIGGGGGSGTNVGSGFAAGGAGGSSAGADGGNGGNYTLSGNGGGGGGGGGGNGEVLTTTTTNAGATGGKGGDGGTGGGGGGGGGAGGFGVVVNGSGLDYANMGSVRGGAGGAGGSADGNGPGSGGVGGGGGDGGIGIVFAGSGTLANSGTIAGGAGGAGATGASGDGSAGVGGAGVVGSGISITNSGSIAGGIAGDGTTQADAIQFTGGTNALTLQGSNWALTGAIEVNNLGTLAFDQSTAQTLGNMITGTGSIIQDGTGALTLTGTNTYSGGTTLSGGTLVLGNNSALGTGPLVTIAGTTLGFSGGDHTIGNAVSVNGDLTFAPAAGTTQTLGGVISDGAAPGTVAVSGGGTLALTGANTYSGGTTLSGGTLVLGNDLALGTGTLAMSAGTTLGFTGGPYYITNNLTVSGDPNFVVGPGSSQLLAGVISDGTSPGTVMVSGGGTLELSGANTYSGGTTICGTTCGVAGGTSIVDVTNANGTSSSIGTGLLTMDGGELQGQGGTPLTFSNPVQLTGNGGTIDPNGITITLTGNVTDATGANGGLTVANSSVEGQTVLVLSGDNTYSGQTTLGGAALEAGSTELRAGSTTGLSPNSAMVIGLSGVLNLNGYSNTIASLADGAGGGGLVLNGGGSAATLTIDGPASGVTSFSGTIADFGSALALVKAGGGTQVLSGSNFYSGGTTLLGGILQPANSNALGSGTLTFDGGSLQAGGSFTLANDIVLDTPSGFIGLNGKILTLSGTITGATGTAGLFVNDNSGLGTLVLTGTSSYTGATTVNSGTLQAGAADVFAPDSAFTVVSGATLALNGYSQTIGSLAGAGNVALGNAILATGGNGTSTTFSGAISGSGGELTKFGGGTLVLSGDNTYSGGTTVFSGTLSVASSSNLGSGGLALFNGATLAITGDSTFGNGVTLAAADPSISVASGVTATWSGVIAGHPGTNAALSLTGPGTLILDAANTYTGGTTIDAGTLEVGDSAHPAASIAGNVTVASGGTLMGHGTIEGTVTNSGDVHPGGSIGVLTVGGNYTQASNGTLTIEVTPNVSAGPGVGYDQLAVSGSASLAGTLAVLDDAGTYSVGTRYTILTAAGGRSGSFSSVSFNPRFASYIDPLVVYDANDVYLTFNPTTTGMNSGQQVPDMLTALASTAQGVGDAVLSDVCGPQARHNAAQLQGCEFHTLPAGYHSELWMRGIGGLGNVTGGGSWFGFNDSYGGMLLGGGIGRGGLTVGLGAGYVATSLHFSDGSAASQNAGVGFVYGRLVRGPLWLGAVAAYGGGQVDGTRELTGAGLSASGNRPGRFAVVQGRAMYDLDLGPVTVEPRASLAYIHAGQSGFAESGASLLDLNYSGSNADQVQGRLTARAKRTVALGGWGVAPWVEAGVQETLFSTSHTVLATDGTYSAAVSGVSPAPTAGLVGVGVDADATNGLDLFVRYQGLFSANLSENAFTGGLRLQF